MERKLEKRFNEIGETDKSRLKKLEEAEENIRLRLEDIEKKIDDAQKYPTTIIATLKAIVERIKRLKTDTEASAEAARDEVKATQNELRNEIKATFEKGIKTPDVILLSDIDEPLEGQTLIVKTLPTTKEGREFRLELSIIFKNQGKGASEPLFVKLYTTDDLLFGSKSSDEKDFTCESYFPPKKLFFEPAILPAGFSVTLNAGFNIRNYNKHIEKFPMLIKVYFGGDCPAQARFFVKIPMQQG